MTKMIAKAFTLVAVTLGALPTLCHADAFTDGKAWGASNNGNVAGSVSLRNGVLIVPGYSVQGSLAPESAYFASGNGALPGFGVAKANGCATNPRSTAPLQQQECDAINFLSGTKDQCDQLYAQINPQLIASRKHCEALEVQRYSPAGLPANILNNDYLPNCVNNSAMQSPPLIQYVRLNCDDVKSRQIPVISRSDPIAVAAQSATVAPEAVIAAAPGGMTLSSYYTGCQSVQTVKPSKVVTDLCYEYRATVKGASCSEARDVQVDPGHPLIPGTPCSGEPCVGGSPDIPAQAPSIIKDNPPLPCQGYTADGENISGCRTKTNCTEGPSTKTYGWDSSLLIYHDCWAWDREYACETPLNPPVDNCSGFRSQGCQEVAVICAEHNIDGGCTAYQHSFQCAKPGSSSTVMNCQDRQFCLDGNCFDAGSAPDADFANAIIGKEALREAGVYGVEGGYRFFNGADDRCEYWPARCCSGGGGGGFSFTNRALLGAASTAYHAVGSTYMYDALFASDAPNWVVDGFGAAFQSGGFDSGIASLIMGELAIENLSVEALMESLIPGPWSLAIMAYQFLMSCPQDATITAMKKDTGLCIEVGGYCSRKLPIFGICIQRKRTYCCFNSLLAKIINQEGKRQLGRGNGSPENPDCSGLTADDFNYIDLSSADPAIWDEFIQQIKPTLPVAANSTTQVGASLPTVTQTITNYYQR